MLERVIPSSKEALPAIGLGTWQTFDVEEPAQQESLRQVLKKMHKAGGRLIDSSPMYGRAETVIGNLTSGTGMADSFFYATKVWTQGRQEGIRQMEASFRKLQRHTIDLMQVHNLVDWSTHLETLRHWKDEGRIRYIGITHYTSAMHEELEKIIRSTPIDFVQFNYSIADRQAENRLLPAAADQGVATLINRPFGEGALLARVRGKSLPVWVADYGIKSWSQLMLKFILSHPAVTCVIPATSNPLHAADNLQAGIGKMPDEKTREKMAALL